MAFPAFFAPLLKPLLIGAGTGALGGLLTGKDPLKGAAIGAATGGLLGGIEAGAMNLSTGSIPSVSVVPDLSSAAAFEASMGLPSSQLISAGAPIGTTFPLADVAAAQPSMFDGLDEYFNPRDLGNVALQGIANQPRQQMIQAPAGGISRGQAPQGTDVMALLQTIRQPERRRISLV